MLDSTTTSTAEVLPLSAEIHSGRDAAAYAKALLRIRVPVAALLVERRLPLERILRIAPGTVLKFDRSCAQPLEVEVGGRRIAMGEAVTWASNSACALPR
jgi:flagellar motor switch/type III secretory pathway protein FliN